MATYHTRGALSYQDLHPCVWRESLWKCLKVHHSEKRKHFWKEIIPKNSQY